MQTLTGRRAAEAADVDRTIVITDLLKVFGESVRALDQLNLTIGDGEFFCLLGPSGCGKTTLLRTIAGLESATSGSIRVGEREITRLGPGDRNLAMVFQDYALYPHMTVRDNIAYPLKIKKIPKDERVRRAEEAGVALSLGQLMDRRPGQLSGGQQQRVALARAVATTPNAFLFDEPLSNLDARLRLEARTFIKQLQRELSTTAIFVTHDQSEALALSDRMAVMELGQIRQVGTPSELFHQPANLFVAGFIGATPMNLVPATMTTVAGEPGVRFGGLDGPVLPLGGASLLGTPPTEGHEVVYGIRPEYTTVAGVADAGSTPGLEGRVTITENLGTEFLVTVDVAGELFRATIEEGHEPAPGDTVKLLAAPHRVLLYDAATNARL